MNSTLCRSSSQSTSTTRGRRERFVSYEYINLTQSFRHRIFLLRFSYVTVMFFAFQLDKGWVHGETYSRTEKTHPRLKPFAMLSDEVCSRDKSVLLNSVHLSTLVTAKDANENTQRCFERSIDYYTLHGFDLTCTIIFCFGKTKYFLGSDRFKDHSKTKYFFGFCFGFAKAKNNCADQALIHRIH